MQRTRRVGIDHWGGDVAKGVGAGLGKPVGVLEVNYSME